MIPPLNMAGEMDQGAHNQVWGGHLLKSQVLIHHDMVEAGIADPAIPDQDYREENLR